MKLEQMYQEIILDHYRNPHRQGLREPFDAESYQINPTCGDEVTLRGALEGDRVTDVSYDAIGCSISQAATSVLTDLVVGRTVAESTSTMDAFVAMVQSRGQAEPDEEVLEDAVAFAGVSQYPSRVKCALLGWMAFKDAVGRADAARSHHVAKPAEACGACTRSPPWTRSKRGCAGPPGCPRSPPPVRRATWPTSMTSRRLCAMWSIRSWASMWSIWVWSMTSGSMRATSRPWT